LDNNPHQIVDVVKRSLRLASSNCDPHRGFAKTHAKSLLFFGLPNGAPYKVIKHAHDTSTHLLPQLFNAIITTGCYPTLWKQANCVVIAKPGKRDPSQAKSYRPIFLLSNIAKMMEKIMARRIAKAALQCKALDTSQFGAIENRSATDALSAILHPSSLWLMQPQKNTPSKTTPDPSCQRHPRSIQQHRPSPPC
jgi:hypothetical protein